MKKYLAILLLLLAVAALTIPVYSHDKVTYAEWGTPVIDGVKDAAWDCAQSISVADEAITDVGDEKATADVWSLWDGKYVYFYAIVKDKTVDAKDKPDLPWDQDAVGFMIDYAYARNKDEVYRHLGNKSYAGYINVPAMEGNKFNPEIPTIFGIAKYAHDVKSYCKITSTGYEIEIQMPLSYKAYSAGDKLGYEICVNNSVGEGTRKSQCVWAHADGANGGNSWQCTYDMGTLILNPQPVAGEVVESAPETALATPTDTAPQTSDSTALYVTAAAIIGLSVIITLKKKNKVR